MSLIAAGETNLSAKLSVRIALFPAENGLWTLKGGRSLYIYVYK